LSFEVVPSILEWQKQKEKMAVVAKEEVVDDWSVLIAQAQGQAEQLFTDAERLINESKAPAIRMQKKEIAPSLVRGILGGRRPFLVVTNTSNSHLRPYKMYINTRDYGNNLDVAWYLVWQPGFRRKRELLVDAAQRVIRDLGSVPAKARVRLFLERYLEGRTVTEIAQELGVSREWCSKAYREEGLRLAGMQFVRLVSADEDAPATGAN
jgi:Homeodomain-like domain